jgi:hypothetical protein
VLVVLFAWLASGHLQIMMMMVTRVCVTVNSPSQ